MINEKTLAEVKSRGLSAGSHTSPDAGFCVMEATALVRGLKFNDNPPCVSKSIRAFLIALNDRTRFAEFRNELINYIPKIFDTKGTADQERQRAYLAADWAVRTIAPIALDACGLHKNSKTLRELPEIIDKATANAANAAAYAAYAASAASAAAYAAYAAAADDAAAYAAAKRRLWDESLKLLDRLIDVTAKIAA